MARACQSKLLSFFALQLFPQSFPQTFAVEQIHIFFVSIPTSLILKLIANYLRVAIAYDCLRANDSQRGNSLQIN
jgi:hypothetical protein